MISEGSCDAEDWSNDAENSALITGINYILTYIHIENTFYIVVIFHKITGFFLWSNNAALLSRRDFFQNHLKPYQIQSFDSIVFKSVM